MTRWQGCQCGPGCSVECWVRGEKVAWWCCSSAVTTFFSATHLDLSPGLVTVMVAGGGFPTPLSCPAAVQVAGTLLTTDILCKHYTEIIQRLSDNRCLQSCVPASWAVFDKYCQPTDETPCLRGAMILHPRGGWPILGRTGQRVKWTRKRLEWRYRRLPGLYSTFQRVYC